MATKEKPTPEKEIVILTVELTREQAAAIEFDVRRMTSYDYETFKRPRPKSLRINSPVVAGWLRMRVLEAVNTAEFQADDYDRIRRTNASAEPKAKTLL